MKKTFKKIKATSQFWFIQSTWFDGEETGKDKSMADVAKEIEGYDLAGRRAAKR